MEQFEGMVKVSRDTLFDLYDSMAHSPGLVAHVVPGHINLDGWKASGWCCVAWNRDVHGEYRVLVVKGVA